jgi:predicted transcriptional regulator
MECQKSSTLIRKLAGILLIGGILLIYSSLVIGAIGKAETSSEEVVIFFGSVNDRNLAQELVEQTGVEAYYYNITEIQKNSYFTFDNETIVAAWWINELLLPIDLTFLGEINNWKQSGRGLFLLNRYFKETPLQNLYHFGINAYAPVVYPLNGSYELQDLNIVESGLYPLNITQTSFEINCSSGWVVIDNKTQTIAEFSPPEKELCLSGLKSGIWLVDNRVVVGSFSIGSEIGISYSRYNFHQASSASSQDIVDLLGEVVQLTLGTLSLGDGPSLQLGGVGEIASIGIIIIASLSSIFVLLKTGLLTRIREILASFTAGFLLFIAHIAYSPQKRRINENQLLENELRVQIIDFLEHKGEQGAHLREIQREVGCGISSLLWHLQALDDFNLITNEKIGKYHIFYLTGIKSVQSTEIALALKSEVAKDLCRLLIIQKRPIALSKISQTIDVHHSSVQHHIKKLAELGVIIILKEKKRSQYSISPKRKSWLEDHLEVA